MVSTTGRSLESNGKSGGTFCYLQLAGLQMCWSSRCQVNSPCESKVHTIHKVLLSSANTRTATACDTFNFSSIAERVVSLHFCVDLHTWLSGAEPYAER